MLFLSHLEDLTIQSTATEYHRELWFRPPFFNSHIKLARQSP